MGLKRDARTHRHPQRFASDLAQLEFLGAQELRDHWVATRVTTAPQRRRPHDARVSRDEVVVRARRGADDRVGVARYVVVGRGSVVLEVRSPALRSAKRA